MTRYRYAARLNSFLTRPELVLARAHRRGPARFDLIERAATVDGPERGRRQLPPADRRHRAGGDALAPGRPGPHAQRLRHALQRRPRLPRGRLHQRRPAVRDKAIDLSRRGVDEAREAGGSMLTLWLGQDGVDHPFEADYVRMWELRGRGHPAGRRARPRACPSRSSTSPTSPGHRDHPQHRRHAAGYRGGRRAEPGRHARLRPRPLRRREPGHGSRRWWGGAVACSACISTMATASATMV